MRSHMLRKNVCFRFLGVGSGLSPNTQPSAKNRVLALGHLLRGPLMLVLLVTGWAAFAQQAPPTIPGVSQQQFPARPGPALPANPSAPSTEAVDMAPAPSKRFPAEWYPPANDWTGMPRAVTGAPYTATTVTTYSLPTPDAHGTVRSESQSATQARDGRGRTRVESVLPGRSATGQNRSLRSVEVNDPVSHCSFRWVEPWTELGEPMATVHCLSRRVHLQPNAPYAGIAALALAQTSSSIEQRNDRWTYAPLGEKEFSGVKALGIRQTKTSDGIAKPLVVDFWWAPELKELVAMKPPQPVFGFPSFELKDIRPGEPDARLFYPPQGYRIVPEDRQP